MNPAENAPDAEHDAKTCQLFNEIMARSPGEAAVFLADYPDGEVEQTIALLNPAMRQDLLAALPRVRRELVLG